jgi:hypothetical protein
MVSWLAKRVFNPSSIFFFIWNLCIRDYDGREKRSVFHHNFPRELREKLFILKSYMFHDSMMQDLCVR